MVLSCKVRWLPVSYTHLDVYKRQAYTSIVAGGANACTLHYNANNCELKNGDLLLIDAGCELDGYASDITRTFPVNGKFAGAQKDVYELVLASQAAAIAKVNTSNHWNAPHEAALDVLAVSYTHLDVYKRQILGCRFECA